MRTGGGADAILGVTEDRDMDFIVVGKCGLGRLAGLMRGCVSQKLASGAHCSVVVVP